MQQVAIFASGKGSNAQAIIQYFEKHPTIQVALVVTNNPGAGVIKIAHQHKIISAIAGKNFLENEENMNRLLDALKIDMIVLAGYLQLVPSFLIAKYKGRIINIHPALLPRHGGKGMYGSKVHQAVLAAGDTETGITIHHVTEHYDEGEVILQKKLHVETTDTADTLAQKVLALEHEWYPKAIEGMLTGA